ncbi:hypothetical protein BLAT2472_40036 [Burkholderia latens]
MPRTRGRLATADRAAIVRYFSCIEFYRKVRVSDNQKISLVYMVLRYCGENGISNQQLSIWGVGINYLIFFMF